MVVMNLVIYPEAVLTTCMSLPLRAGIAGYLVIDLEGLLTTCRSGQFEHSNHGVFSCLLLVRSQCCYSSNVAGVRCRLGIIMNLVIDLDLLMATRRCLFSRDVGRRFVYVRAIWSADDTLEEPNHGFEPANVEENLNSSGLFAEPQMLIQLQSLLNAYAADLFQIGCPEFWRKESHMISGISFDGDIKPPPEHKLLDCLCFGPEYHT